MPRMERSFISHGMLSADRVNVSSELKNAVKELTWRCLDPALSLTFP
jgi:hypothetical protein